MSVQLTSSLDQVKNTVMSPITHLPQSAGEAEPFSARAKRAGSPQRISNGFSPSKSNSILSPKKTTKRFFRRNTLEKNQIVETGSAQSNDKKKQSTPKVEIIYKDSPQSENESEESNVASLKKAFEIDGSPSLRPASTHSGERTPSAISDEATPSAALLGVQGLDVNMNRISTGSSTSHTERVVQEILSTEQAYVQHLHEIIEGYLQKMRKKNSPFLEQDVKDLFMNIEEIYEFNKTFLAELEEVGDDPVDVASHFVSKEKGFKTYTDYCTNYPVSMEVLTKSTQQKETADFIKKIQVELGHSLPLGSYLLKPVQRILKYHLLLQDIQKHFDKESYPEGYDIISDALTAMTGVAHHINEMKRQHEQAVHVQEIQSQMSDFEGPDLTTYGSLVLEDTFRIYGSRTDRYLFLFEKILLITKRKEAGYSCKSTLMLSNMMLSESVPKEPLAFEIIRFDNQKYSYTFLARNADQKHKWTLELKGLIVDSLAAQVPKKAKALILGKENVKERSESEAFNKKRTKSIDKLSRGTPQLKGSTVGNDWKKKQETSRRSDDESEPRSPSDTYSSDDDKKPVRPQSLLSDRENDLEECEETTEEDSGIFSETGVGHVGDGEQRLSSQQPDKHMKEVKNGNSAKLAEQNAVYSVQDAQGKVLGTTSTESVGIKQDDAACSQEESEGFEKLAEETTRYSVENANGEVWTRTSESDSVTHDGAGKEKDLSTPEKGATEENTVKRIPPIPRKRSSSLSKCESLQTLRNKSVTSLSSDKAASDSGKVQFSPIPPRRTSSSGHRLLVATLSNEKSSSACDLRDINEGSPSVFSHSDEITDLVEYSTIQTTVRKVSRAFSGSSPPSERRITSESSTRSTQTRYFVESRGSPGKDTSFSGSDSSQSNLEELLASIDRDLDETRRTISSAQLLESALLIKNDIQPLTSDGELTDSLRRRRRPRIIDFSMENGDSRSNELKNSSKKRNERSVLVERENRGQEEKGARTNLCQKPLRTVAADFSENKNFDGVEEITRQKELAPSEPDVFSGGSVPQDNPCGAKPQEDQGPKSTPSIANTPVKKRVFELFADSSSQQVRNVEKESSETEPAHAITATKAILPNVHEMARQYSQRVTDKKLVDEIRMHTRSKLHGSKGSVTFESGEEDATDHTPKIKIERITKVSFSSNPIESYKLVRRRKRRSGSSRHRSDEFRRQSWSVEKVKPDTEEPRKVRPKSVYDIEALEATLAENLDQIEEGLEPMLIEGLEKDDVVVRGLVQHLVNKFSTQKTKTT